MFAFFCATQKAYLITMFAYFCAAQMAYLIIMFAGGWLAGAAMNTMPELFQAAVLTVPSLDALGPMLEDHQDSLDELDDALHDHACFEVR